MISSKVQTTVTTTERHSRAKEQLLTLARRIRVLREQRRMTQEELAARCGISVSFASLLERGERSPSYETLVEVAQALEISLSDLFREAQAEAYDDPYYSRLMEFARKGKISRAQVDQLVAVGNAMFGLQSTAAAAKPSSALLRRDTGTCTSQGCERPVLARGLCASHYHRERRARL